MTEPTNFLEVPDDKCQTVAERDVQFFKIIKGQEYPIYGAYLFDDTWFPARWTALGEHSVNVGANLTLKPVPTRTVKGVMYWDGYEWVFREVSPAESDSAFYKPESDEIPIEFEAPSD